MKTCCSWDWSAWIGGKLAAVVPDDLDIVKEKLSFKQLEGGVQEMIHINRFHQRLALTGEIEQVPDDRVATLGFLFDTLQVFPDSTFRRHLLHDQTAEQENAAQGVIDLVRHSGGQLADHRQTIRAHQLFMKSGGEVAGRAPGWPRSWH